MKLVLSSVHNVDSVTDKDHLLLLVDTNERKIEWIFLNVQKHNDVIGSKSLCMSGDLLVASLKTKSKTDKLLIIDVVTKRNVITSCLRSKEIRGLVSVFRGRMYCISSFHDTMNQIVLSPSTNNVIRDVLHYSFGESKSDNYHITSLLNWNRKWFVSFHGKNWRSDNNGAIIELSNNNRVIYSNINQPNSIMINRNHELCFCESGKGLFHFGNSIVHVGNYPRGLIEDRENNGYWIGLSAERKEFPSIPARLLFVDYDGLVKDEIVIPHTYDIFDIVEAEGYLTKLL